MQLSTSGSSPMGVGVMCCRGEPRPNELSPWAGGLGPTTQPGFLTWAAPSSLEAAALAWPWGHWSTSVSSTSRFSPLVASFICRDQSRAQLPIPPKGHGLKELCVCVGAGGGEAVQWYEDRRGAPALGTHLVWGVVCAEFQERDHSVVQEQQDAGAHVHGPVVAGVKDQCVGTGAVRMGHKVLKTENPVQRRHGTDL